LFKRYLGSFEISKQDYCRTA